MRKKLLILTFIFAATVAVALTRDDIRLYISAQQKQGILDFPTATTPPPATTQLTFEATSNTTQQVDWVYEGQGRCWNAWSAESCGLLQHEGGVTIPSMKDLDHDGVEDISCSQGGTKNGTTITNNSDRTITINCERYICNTCVSGDGIHAQCDGGTDPNANRVSEAVELSPGCTATCTMQGVYGTCLTEKTPPDISKELTATPTQQPTTPPGEPTNTPIPTATPTITQAPLPTNPPNATQGPRPTSIETGSHMPITIDYSSYTESYNVYSPTYIYAMMNRSYNAQTTSRGISGLSRINGNVVKMIMVSEYDALEQILKNHGAEIQAAGITWVGYNAERDGRTPQSELSTIFSSNASNNIIAKMGKLTNQHGLKLMLGPVTPMWNEYFGGRERTSPQDGGAAIEAMVGGSQCYLDGVAFQEQKQISRTNKVQRSQIIAERTAFFRTHANDCHQFEAMVQIMSSWCTQNASWDECKEYYNLLKNLEGPSRINSLAIWASGSERNDLPRFIEFLRN